MMVADGRLLLSHSVSISVSMTWDDSDNSLFRQLSLLSKTSTKPTSVPVEMPVIHKMFFFYDTGAVCVGFYVVIPQLTLV